MSKQSWIIIVSIIVIGMGSIAYYTNFKANNIVTNDYRDQAIDDIIKKPDVTINVKHQYKDGQHIYLGTFEVPTPCHEYSAEIENTNEGKNISLSYSDPEEGEICAQVITEREFKLTFESDEDIIIDATLNGVLVNLNIFEVSSDKNIDEVETYIKG